MDITHKLENNLSLITHNVINNELIKCSKIKQIISDNIKIITQNELFIILIEKYPHMYDEIEMIFLFEFNYEPKKYRMVENRRYQNTLRNNAIKKYKKCVISGKTNILLLQAAHIKQVYECDTEQEKSDNNNVLLLWIDLHKYFDRYLLSINPHTLLVEISSNVLDNNITQYKGQFIKNINNETKKYIEHHYNMYKIMESMNIQ